MLRLEEVEQGQGLDVLKQFDQRLEVAAQSLINEDRWLDDLIAAGGSPPEVLRLPSSQPNAQV